MNAVRRPLRMFAIAFVSFAISLMLQPNAHAQVISPLSLNGSFDRGLTNWNVAPSGAKVYSAAGDNRLDLTFVCGLWQYVPLSNESDYVLLNCQGYKFRRERGPAGFAGIGIMFYGANWGFIDSFEKQLSNVTASVADPLTSDLPSCSLGVKVPKGAVHAIIWAGNATNNEQAIIDNLTLFNYFPSPGNSNPQSFALVTYPSLLTDSLGITQQLSGLEFWNLSSSFVDQGTGAVGTVGAASTISREIALKPNTPYTISANTSVQPVHANFGVDYFDANWNRIGGDFGFLTETFYPLIEINTPAGVVHSVFWVWVDSLPLGGEQFAPAAFFIDEVDVTPPELSLLTSIPPVRTANASVEFDVVITDDISGGNLLTILYALEVRGPTGKVFEVIGGVESPLGPGRFAVTQPPSGTPIDWSREAPGTYTISLLPNRFSDYADNLAPAKQLGVFTVDLAASARSAPPASKAKRVNKSTATQSPPAKKTAPPSASTLKKAAEVANRAMSRNGTIFNRSRK